MEHGRGSKPGLGASGATSTTAAGSPGVGSGSGGGSGIGHMCIVMVQSGSTTVSHTWGKMMSPVGPTRS